MIVCSCNVLSDHAIRRTIATSEDCAARMSEVFGCLGCRPQCGRCAPTVKRLIRESVAADATTCPSVLDDVTPPAEIVPLGRPRVLRGTAPIAGETVRLAAE